MANRLPQDVLAPDRASPSLPLGVRVVPDSFSVALQHVLLDVPAGCYLALPEPQLAAWLRPPLMAAFSRAVARLLRQLTPATPVRPAGVRGPPAGWCGRR